MSLETDLDALVEEFTSEITPTCWANLERDHALRAINLLENSDNPYLLAQAKVLREFLDERSGDKGRIDGTTYKSRFKLAVAVMVAVTMLRHGRHVSAREFAPDGDYEAILQDVFLRLGCFDNVHRIACEAVRDTRVVLQVNELMKPD